MDQNFLFNIKKKTFFNNMIINLHILVGIQAAGLVFLVNL